MLIPVFYIDSIEDFSIAFSFIHEISVVLFINLTKLLLTV